MIYLDNEVKWITGKGVYGEISAGGHQGLKAGPRSRNTATTHAACFISSPLRPATSLKKTKKLTISLTVAINYIEQLSYK